MEVDGEEEPPVVLVEFRAGVMARDATSGHIVADSRKGLLRVVVTDDTLTHVQWYNRVGAQASGAAEHDDVVFPTECALKPIPAQPRCYVLEFPEDKSRNLFFWLQQPKPDEDAALVARFNQAVNGQLDPQDVHAPPPAPPAAAAAPAPAAVGGGAGVSAAQQGANDLAMALSAALNAATARAAAASSRNPDPTALAASLLQQLAAAGGGGGGGGGRPRLLDDGPGLHEVLKPELLIPVVQQPGVLEQLAPHLPEEHRTAGHVVSTLRSAQFQQQMGIFSQALQTGQLDLRQFGLSPKGFSIADFLEAIQEMVDKEKGASAAAQQQPPPPAPGDGGDKDQPMS